MNDDTPTIEPPAEDEKQTSEAPASQAPGTRRLLRSTNDRVLGGVAGGLGQYFGVDPVIFRIGFALSIFLGGLGILTYLLLAIFVPNDGDPDRAALGGRLREMGFWRGLGVVALVLIAIGGLFALAGGAAFTVALGWGVSVALVIIAIGTLLTLAAFRGGARWLIPPAVALAVGASVAAASDVDLSGGMGEREYRPLTAEAIPANGYRLGVGRLVVDLRDLDWSEQALALEVSVGAGEADIYVPERVCVTGKTRVGAGESRIAGERNEGVDVEQRAGAGSNAVPRIELDADVDLGQLRVINDDLASVAHDDRHHEAFHGADGALRAVNAKACEGR